MSEHVACYVFSPIGLKAEMTPIRVGLLEVRKKWYLKINRNHLYSLYDTFIEFADMLPRNHTVLSLDHTEPGVIRGIAMETVTCGMTTHCGALAAN